MRDGDANPGLTLKRRVGIRFLLLFVRIDHSRVLSACKSLTKLSYDNVGDPNRFRESSRPCEAKYDTWKLGKVTFALMGLDDRGSQRRV